MWDNNSFLYHQNIAIMEYTLNAKSLRHIPNTCNAWMCVAWR